MLARFRTSSDDDEPDASLKYAPTGQCHSSESESDSESDNDSDNESEKSNHDDKYDSDVEILS
jgi:hypothetical protein